MGALGDVGLKRARMEVQKPMGVSWLSLKRRSGAQAALDPTRDNLRFMKVDADSTTLPDSAAAVVRLFGVMEDGTSILVRARGFHPYLFIQQPHWMSKVPNQVELERFRAELERKVQHLPRATGGGPVIVQIEHVLRRSIMYFIPGDPMIAFFKITVALPRHVRDVAGIIERGVDLDSGPLGRKTWEVTVDFVLRFLIDREIVGCGWVEIPANTYTLVAAAKTSAMQIEVDVQFHNIVAHKPEGEWLKIAPLRRLSFDIECAGRKGVFPEPEHDSVIQIANYVTLYGSTSEDPLLTKCVFTLNTCAPIADANVYSFDTERELLTEWASFLRAVDPEILTGYNIVNFDLPYLLDRARILGVSSFPYLGRIPSSITTMRNTQMSSSAFGTHESKEFTMEGRVVMDMLQVITRDYKLRSYSLNSVSAEFLGEQKEDVHHSIISDLQAGNEQTRRRLAVYCLKDAVLPQRLMDKLMSLTNYMEMSRVSGIPLGWLFARGHMIKVVSLLHRRAQDEMFLIPDLPRSNATGDGPQFEGATVIEPNRGFYTDPIATLDFASLYPSIIMAHNLCYSTLILPDDVQRLRVEDYTTTPAGHHFVRKEVKKGILSNILEGLLAARKKAKADLKAEKDPFRRGILDGRQLALKISANAVYGFTGATVGKLCCMEISASTTAYGREMIEKTKASVESLFSGSEVIYGDTDSVMIKFGSGKSLEECMGLGAEAAEKISNLFPKPVRLEFEKCYWPYLLISKKRYAGLYWTKTETYDKMDTKGIESVRRDNCKLVASVISKVLEMLLMDRDLDLAIRFVKQTISDLLQNKIDLSLLVVSKALTKAGDKYDAKQAHVVLAEKMRARNPGTAPSLGDRVPYVITKGAKNSAAYERAEDPLFCLEHSIPIDNAYYLENMLRKPLERIFEPIMTNVATLFSGDHTRTINVGTPRNGGIMKFAKVSITCLGCRSPIKAGALCQFCSPKEAEFYLKHLAATTSLEKQYSSLWTECQRCMGDICQDVLCSNSDCPIFYRRKRVQKELDETTKKLDRFHIDW
uniref:DNA polymerase n=1 Tax=Compsopogon caeruleus TaxID=31354 RepID=A0A7S1TGT0_9RHOD|mmetsp:Transcript_3395/g.6372  ORF Transcript_3395/g.6372 Transcript_3395/m.6372 type:complete len:1039 (+) Transcript_3395:57-3173(+)